MPKQSVTLSIDSESWHDFQKHCIDNSTKPSKLIQRFIEQTIRFRRKKKTHLTAQQEARLLLRKLSQEIKEKET